MGIKVQKILLFIPGVNTVSLLILSFKMLKQGFKMSKFLGVYSRIALVFFAFMIPEMIVTSVSSNYLLNRIICGIFQYLQLFAVSAVALREQIKLGQVQSGDGYVIDKRD